jgi:2-C-methyl-D-erythritol 4-phosphate cytidylyltransferase
MALFSAVLVAAGRSQRFLEKSSDRDLRSKVFLEWKGRPLFLFSLEKLLSWVDGECAVVVRDEHRDVVEPWISKLEGFDRVRLVSGGARRQDSVRNGLKVLSNCEYVAIHDAARPILSSEMLENLKIKVLEHAAVIPAIRLTETIKEVETDGRVRRTIDRSRLVRVQTPQVFKYSLIRGLHDRLADSNEDFTDDAMICENFEVPVYIAEGVPSNIKVTTPEDVLLLDQA